MLTTLLITLTITASWLTIKSITYELTRNRAHTIATR